MAIQQHAFRPTAHPSRSIAFTITLLLLVVGSVVARAVADIVRRPLTLSQRVVTHHHDSNVDDADKLEHFFEVTKPVTTGHHHVETIPILYHEFADTSGMPPPNASYVPTKKVRSHKKWNKVVLRFTAVCRGLQFDRIAGVWLGGVEILRTCTAEPSIKGITWEVEKDVTRYASLWEKPQLVVLSLGNVVDSTYTGIINVTLSVEFYHVGHSSGSKKAFSKHSKLDGYSAKPADVILPISEPNHSLGTSWFQLSSDRDKVNTSLKIPPNTYKAVLEVCLSPHGEDEFWFTNLPNDYLEANNITSFPGNGPFREVVASIDDRVVGVVYPFAVLYTGGVNLLFWRPAAAIGAFDLPSYDIDITPLVGLLLDGKSHTFSFTVPAALSAWLVQGNLHIWVDPKQKSTTGGLLEFSAPPPDWGEESHFNGLDGTFMTSSSRTFSYAGYVASSFGNLTTSSSYTHKFSNTQVMSNGSLDQAVDQETESESIVVVRTAKKEVSLDRVATSYPLVLTSSTTVNEDGSYLTTTSLEHSLKKDLQSMTKKSSSFSSLTNKQSSDGSLLLSVNNTILSGNGATQQVLSYQSSEGCYERSISTDNYSLESDSSTDYCSYTS